MREREREREKNGWGQSEVAWTSLEKISSTEEEREKEEQIYMWMCVCACGQKRESEMKKKDDDGDGQNGKKEGERGKKILHVFVRSRMGFSRRLSPSFPPLSPLRFGHEPISHPSDIVFGKASLCAAAKTVTKAKPINSRPVNLIILACFTNTPSLSSV